MDSPISFWIWKQALITLIIMRVMNIFLVVKFKIQVGVLLALRVLLLFIIVDIFIVSLIFAVVTPYISRNSHRSDLVYFAAFPGR